MFDKKTTTARPYTLLKKLVTGSALFVFFVVTGCALWLVTYQEYFLFPYYHQTVNTPLSERGEPVPPNVRAVLLKLHGQQIETWTMSPEGESKGIALVFRANMGKLVDHISLIELAADHGLTGVLFNYPGMGLSDGVPSEAAILEAAGEVYRHYRKELLKEGGKTWVIGYSIGTGPAGIFAAQENPDLLILFAPYTDLTDVVSSKPRYRFLAGFSRFHFPLREPIAKLGKTNLIVATGGRDETIPPAMSMQVFDAYRGTGRKFHVENPDGIHEHLLGANRNELNTVLQGLGY